MDCQEQAYKQRHNIMKMEDFREKKEEQLVAKIFRVLRNYRKHDVYQHHYHFSLYCKVIKGFMINQMQLNAFAERLENVYVNILLNTHFKAIKEFKRINQEEMQLKIQSVYDLIIKNRGVKVIRNMKRQLDLKKQSQKAKQEVNQAYHLQFKTDQPLHQIKKSQPSAPRQYLSRPLQDSRKSVYSAFSMTSDLPSRRKFTTVKQMPSRPNLQSILEQQPKIERQEEHVNSQQNVKESRQHQNPIPSSQLQQKIKVEEVPKDEKDDNSLKKIKNIENILQAISKLKILQLSTIDTIIEQYQTNLKTQSLINQKNYRQITKKTIQSLIQFN